MNLFEIFQPEAHGYESKKDDHSVTQPKQTRRSKLTLKRLSKLRMVNDVRKLEHEKYLEKVSKQYKLPTQTSGLSL